MVVIGPSSQRGIFRATRALLALMATKLLSSSSMASASPTIALTSSPSVGVCVSECVCVC